jgi:hypothetical protein
MKSKVLGSLLLLSVSMAVIAQSSEIQKVSPSTEGPISKKALKVTPSEKNKTQKAKMRFVGTFESGYEDAGIYKMVDESDGVICYVLMPDNSSNRIVEGKLIYEGNNVGSISCVKAR